MDAKNMKYWVSKYVDPMSIPFDESTNFVQYIGSMMNNMIGAISALEDIDIPHCIRHSAPRMGSEIEAVLSDPNKRKELLERGAQTVTEYLKSGVEELSD